MLDEPGEEERPGPRAGRFQGARRSQVARAGEGGGNPFGNMGNFMKQLKQAQEVMQVEAVKVQQEMQEAGSRASRATRPCADSVR